jgi:glycosyltransferase involved in cell wall biosynthesis
VATAHAQQPQRDAGGRVRILYLSYTGLLEPLGQSQVLAYLKVLSRDHKITLVTYEKGADLDDAAAIQAQREVCARHGIVWIARRYHQHPRLLATAWDMLVFFLTALTRAGGCDVIHARAYIASFTALAVHTLTGKPFIFDMRALWPEEMVVAGRLDPNSAIYRLLKWGERQCLQKAGATVSLTRAAIPYLRERAGKAGDRIRFEVIPTCADLDRFTPTSGGVSAALAIGTIGTVMSGWFRFTWFTAFLRAVARRTPDQPLAIISREDGARIRDAALKEGVPAAHLSVYGVKFADAPDAMRSLEAVALFFEPGQAKLASSPTRMGEALGCGLPVIVNPGVGDVDDIVLTHRVGVVVEESSDAAMDQAVEALVALQRDPELPRRCRDAAEAIFSLRQGANAYDRLYRALASAT